MKGIFKSLLAALAVIFAVCSTTNAKIYTPKNKTELIEIVKNKSIPLSDIDTRNITDMSKVFANSKRKNFNGIENWNVSNVINMNSMFKKAINFNQPLDKWNVGKVENMAFMFAGANSFDQPLDSWNVANVKNMTGMFFEAINFNQDLNKWNIVRVEKVKNMFVGAMSMPKENIKSWSKYIYNIDELFIYREFTEDDLK